MKDSNQGQVLHQPPVDVVRTVGLKLKNPHYLIVRNENISLIPELKYFIMPTIMWFINTIDKEIKRSTL